jgi:hypothetical protein
MKEKRISSARERQTTIKENWALKFETEFAYSKETQITGYDIRE